MARITISLDDLGDKIVGVLEKKILAELSTKIMDRVESEIKDEVAQSVARQNFDFVPNNRQAGELGIQSVQLDGNQQLGEIEEERRSKGWMPLLPNFSDTAFFLKRRKNTITLGWDFEKLYKHPINHFTIRKSEKNGGGPFEIEWMRWFIEGAAINNFHFVPRTFKSSRTGEGVMAIGGLWSFRPQRRKKINLGENTAKSIVKRIEALFSQRNIF